MPQVLPGALHRVHRGGGTLQLGLDPRRAVLVAGLDPRARKVLQHPGPSTDLGAALSAAGARPVDRERLLALLAAAGILIDDAGNPAPTAAVPPDADRLAPDRASATLLGGSGAGAVECRRTAWVQVRGGGRVGASVAALLAVGGVGHVLVEDDARLTPADLGAVGDASQVGAPRGVAAERSARRASSAVRHDPPPGRAAPDLVVVAPVRGLGRAEAAGLVASGVTHLLALVVETVGIVGPLVRPGETSCLRCQDLHRTDRDPGWPAVLDQAGIGSPDPACDVTLAALVAAQAAQQALAHLDGWAPTTLDASLETSLPDGLTRRRSWRPHPACGCRWDDDDG